MKFGTIAWGGIMALFELWYLGRHPGMVVLAIAMVPVCFAGGWLWSYFMWQVIKGDIEQIEKRLGQPESTQQKAK